MTIAPLFLVLSFSVKTALPLEGDEIKYRPEACFQSPKVQIVTTRAQAEGFAGQPGALVFEIDATRKGIVVKEIVATQQTGTKAQDVPTAPNKAAKK
jgi:hypothetical protein